jgi:terminase small subunit-like protein
VDIELDEPKKTGRPSSYTPEIAEEICRRMADGESVLKICKEPGMPSTAAIFRWLEAKPAFREQYARARELQAHHYFERIVQIAFDDKSDFFVDNETGKVISDHVRVARARLQVDALKWCSAKLLPKVYGDRGDRHEGVQADAGPITITWAASDPPEPPPAREPPRQIPYKPPSMPADLTPGDWSVLMQVLEQIKRTIPSNSDTPPGQVFEVIRKAFHFADK